MRRGGKTTFYLWDTIHLKWSPKRSSNWLAICRINEELKKYIYFQKRDTVDYRNLEETGIDAPTGEDDDVQEERTDVAAYLSNGGPAPPVLLYVSGSYRNLV